MKWKDNFATGRKLVLATASRRGLPNANIVVSLGMIGDKLLVADCQMKTTIKNLKANKNICVLGGYLRAKGKVQIFSSGRYFDLCVKKSKGYKVKHAILISISQVFDLDNGKKIL